MNYVRKTKVEEYPQTFVLSNVELRFQKLVEIKWRWILLYPSIVCCVNFIYLTNLLGLFLLLLLEFLVNFRSQKKVKKVPVWFVCIGLIDAFLKIKNQPPLNKTS